MEPMSTHNNHHYVPVFLLNEWAVNKNKLIVFKRLRNGELRTDPLGPKAVAAERHLYSVGRHSGTPDNHIEKDFLGERVDDPASVAHKIMLKDGLGALTASHREAWARYLIAGLLRLPDAVGQLRKIEGENLRRQFESMALIAGQPEVIKTMVGPRFDDIFADEGMSTFVKAISSKKHIDWILKATWAIVEIPPGVGKALIADGPIDYAGDLMENCFGMVTPISPLHYFWCANAEPYISSLKSTSPKSMMKLANKKLVQIAAQYVYGVDEAHRPFIDKWLRKPPANPKKDKPAQGGLHEAEAA